MKQRSIPMRRCVGCMESFPQSELIRITWDGKALRIDDTGRAKGRGCYLCKRQECIDKVRKNKGFQRAYKTNIETEKIDALLTEAAQSI